MSQAEFLKKIFAELERLGIAAMLVGSHASSFYGEARTTHDIDIVIDLPAEKIPKLIQAFPAPRYYLSEIALREGRMANLIDTDSGDKADFFILGNDPSRRSELDRRQKQTVMGSPVFLATPEDTIVAKLRWSVESGGSERQIQDVQHMVAVQAERLDRDFIQRRLLEDGLPQQWQLVSDMLERS